jgi:hypothetical protein
MRPWHASCNTCPPVCPEVTVSKGQNLFCSCPYQVTKRAVLRAVLRWEVELNRKEVFRRSELSHSQTLTLSDCDNLSSRYNTSRMGLREGGTSLETVSRLEPRHSARLEPGHTDYLRKAATDAACRNYWGYCLQVFGLPLTLNTMITGTTACFS